MSTDSSQLHDFIASVHERDLKVTEAIARFTQAQEDMSARLFGGPTQKGMLPYMIENAATTAKELRGQIEIVEHRTTALESWRGTSRSWLAGAVAILGLEGTALGLYFSKIAAHIQVLHK